MNRSSDIPSVHAPTSPAPQRMTKQRRAVLAELERDPAFRSAQQIHATLEVSDTPVGLATVYRHLQVLEQAGQVDAVTLGGGETLYRLCERPGHHHHLVCQACGETEEFSVAGLEQAVRDLAADHGYLLQDHNLELFGLCGPCQKEQA